MKVIFALTGFLFLGLSTGLKAQIPLSEIVNATPGTAGEKIVEVRATEIAYIDGSVDVGELKIQGKLVCNANSPNGAEIKAKTIYVNGIFECGTSTARYLKKLTLSLKHSSTLVPKSSTAYRGMIVNSGGKLFLHGDNSRLGVSKLQGTIAVGKDVIVLDRNINTAWKIGDEIVIGPTSYNPAEGEVFKILGFPTANSIKLSALTRYLHWGATQNFATSRGNIVLDQRAEVINLTRNIVIRADESQFAISESETALNAELGGHVMVNKGGFGYVDSVEFSRMGQAGIMGRYPFHWHLAGDVSGQYIKNSSIHRSFQRCLTIHQTNKALVDFNSCYSFKGHGYFLETGNEIDNIISNNIGIGAKVPYKSKRLLASDDPAQTNAMRFAGVSVFWITHPQNTVKNNIAAGSVGTGFWMSFIPEVRQYNTTTKQYDGTLLATPGKTNTTLYTNNVAHSNLLGHTWDGGMDVNRPVTNLNNEMDRAIGSAHYAPPTIPVFSKLVAWKNQNCGIYFRGNTAIYDNAILADNGWHFFYGYNQVTRNTLIVGKSANNGAVEENYLYTLGRWKQKQFGIVMYDGPFELENVDFMSYPTTKFTKTIGTETLDLTAVPIATIGGARKYANFSRGLRFSPEPYYRMYDDAGFQVAKGSGWLDNLTSNTLRDLDGTLTGTAGSVVVSDNAYLSNSTCSVKTTPLASSYTGFRICSPGFQSLNLFLGGTSNINKIPFIMVKDSNTSSLANLSHLSILADPARGTYLNKVGLITSSNHSYDMLFRKTDLNGDILDNLSFHANSESPNLSTPLIRLHGLGTNCKLNNNAVQVSSLSALSSNTSAAAYYSSGNDFVVKFKTVNFESNLINPSATGPGHGLHTSNAHGYSCTGPVVSGIKGTIDSVKQVGTKIEVTGWACDYGEETSIPVHIYIGGSAGTPGAVGYAVTANASSEPAISIACGRAFSSYRFKWSAERTTLASLIGKKVYAHGLSATNGPNLLISNSGTYSIP